MDVAEFVAENILKSATDEEQIENASKILESQNTKNRWKHCVFRKIELPQNFLWEFVLEQDTGVEPASVLTGGFPPIHRNCPWQYAAQGKDGKSKRAKQGRRNAVRVRLPLD